MNITHTSTATRILLIVSCVIASGCGSDLELYPVTGRVVYKDGKPFPGGGIVFQLQGAGMLLGVSGDIGENGQFELGTREPGDGAQPGTYRVAVLPPARSERDDARLPPIIDKRFTYPEESGLTYTVEKTSNEFLVEVETP
ncbi:hypothetical protein [Bythopirellula polymerisocia]|nr:hypothetical protein [Bythopirellula polymerisocia]